LVFTLKSLGFPVKGHQPTNPFEGTKVGTFCAIVAAVNPSVAAIVKNKFFFILNTL
jgi:hypothetical protein